MSEGTVTFAITADTTAAFASIAELQAAIDEQAREARIHRNKLMREIREGFMLISQMMSSFRQAMSLIGAQVDPFFSALIGMVLSTTSMLISAATTLALTGIGGIAAAILFGIAVSFNILTTAKLISDQEFIQEGFRSMIWDLRGATARLAAQGPRTAFGVGF